MRIKVLDPRLRGDDELISISLGFHLETVGVLGRVFTVPNHPVDQLVAAHFALRQVQHRRQ
jgi:hypothetical protein